jgi:Inner membrane protein YgaP-like, transmembrane domain
MTFLNEGEWDRGVRMLGGTLMFGLGWSLATGTPGIVLMGLGAIALITGIAGWCPAYALFGFSTRKTAGGHRSNGDAGHADGA